MASLSSAVCAHSFGALTETLVQLMEQLLFLRRQMPMPLKSLLQSLDADLALANQENEVEVAGRRRGRLDAVRRRRRAAKSTRLTSSFLDSVNVLSRDFRLVLENEISEVLQVVFLLGTTSNTPKEAFVVNLPSLESSISSCVSHSTSSKLVRSLFLALLTDSDVHERFLRHPLGATNLFVAVKVWLRDDENEELMREELEFRPEMESVVDICVNSSKRRSCTLTLTKANNCTTILSPVNIFHDDEEEMMDQKMEGIEDVRVPNVRSMPVLGSTASLDFSSEKSRNVHWYLLKNKVKGLPAGLFK